MVDRADHIAWIVAIIGVPLAVGAWLGVPNIWIPMAFMILTWLGSLAYIHVMHSSRHVWVQIVFDVASTMLFGIVCLVYWSLFVVHIEIRMVDAIKNSAGGKNVRIEVELTNQGKATGLQKWRAELVDEHGTIYYGKPVT